MSAYRTSEPAEEPEVELVLPRPSLWTPQAVGLLCATLVLVGLSFIQGPSPIALIGLPFAALLTWIRWGFLRATRLSVRPTKAGWSLRLHQRAALRPEVVTEFTMRRSARVEFVSRSIGLSFDRIIGSLELSIDGKVVHLLELVEEEDCEQLVTQAALAFNEALEKRTRQPSVAPAFMSKFILALKTDDAAVVRGLLKQGLPVSATHEEDSLAEHAAIRGAQRSLAAVLEAGCAPTPRALALSAWGAPKNDPTRIAEHLACAEMLLAAGVSPDAVAVDAGTAREAFLAAGPAFVALLARAKTDAHGLS